jgi:hypothetical protein
LDPFRRTHLIYCRCVWRLCVVDNPRDLKLLSVKEQRAQKLLRKARAGLNKSKVNRLGGRVHDGYSLPDGKTLTGGEQFPTMLRSIVSSTTLKMETQELKGRREKVSRHSQIFFIRTGRGYHWLHQRALPGLRS